MLGIRYKNVTFWLYQRYGWWWVVWDGAISGIAFLYWDPTSTSTHRKPKLLPKTAKTRPKCSRLPAGQCSDEMEDIPMIMLYLLSHILSNPPWEEYQGNAGPVHPQFWMKCTNALSQPRLSTVCSEIYTSSLPPSPAFSYLSSNDVSIDGLLSFNGEHASLNEQYVASHSPKAASSCDGRHGERLFWAKLNVSNWKHRKLGNIKMENKLFFPGTKV